MRHFLAATLLVPACLLHTHSCAQRWNTGKHAPGADVYKHYTGTLGGKKVTLDLRYGYNGSSNYGGSTYYFPDKDERTLFYIRQPADFSRDVPLVCFEQPEDTALITSRTYDNTSASWLFKITGDKLTGTWHSGIDRDHAVIELVEDYTNSCPMELAFFSNNLDVLPYPTAMICAIPSSRMNKEDAAFVTSEEISFLSGGKSPFTTWEAYEQGNAGRFDANRYLVPVYNDNGILVIENEYGSSHLGNLELSYLTLDIRNHKRLQADDMLNLASMKLSGLLEDAFRKKYGILATEPLSSRLRHDRIPSTKMVYPVHSGIVFCYMPDELAKDKEVAICVPYHQLRGILTPEFSKRLGLN
jgi:hypothetical protein